MQWTDPGQQQGGVLVGRLFLRAYPVSFSVGNSRAAGKRVVAEGHLPILGRDELGAIQKLSAIQKRPGEVGAIEHCLEKVRLRWAPDKFASLKFVPLRSAP
jgi:hypothetical protein